MGNCEDIRKNGSGIYDPTAYKAIKNVERQNEHTSDEDDKFNKLLRTIFSVCELSGFHVEERIVLKDIESGKVWR